MENKKYKVGDKVYIAYMDKRNEKRNRYVEIAKIGRKYMYFGCRNEGVIDIERMREHDPTYSSSFAVYDTQEEYERKEYIKKCRRELCVSLSPIPDDVIIELYEKYYGKLL